MRIVLLHLSDLHISSKNAIDPQKIQKVSDSLTVFKDFDGVLLALTGDIANSGKKNEYKLAVSFIDQLLSQIKCLHNIPNNNISVVLVPGNHDVSFDHEQPLDRKKVQELYKNREIDNEIESYLENMSNFYQFAFQQNCFKDKHSPLLDKKILTFTNDLEECTFEINMINSCLFSSSDDKGIHYFPAEFYQDLKNFSPATYSITLMHHSPHWFSNNISNTLQEIIYNSSDFLLYGHEHTEHTENVLSNASKQIILHSCGSWWKKSFDNSSYIAGCIDTNKKSYRHFDFDWSENYYRHSNMKDILLKENSRDVELRPHEEFINELISEENFNVCNDIRKYFVFPSVHKERNDGYESNSSFDTLDELVSYILSKTEILLFGLPGSGKTTISKILFLELYQKYTVLWCNAAEFSGKKQNNIIRYLFNSIYDIESYPYFEQQELGEKIIIIDDFDLIEEKSQNKFLHGLNNHFGHIVLIGEKKRSTMFDIKETVCRNFSKSNISELSIGRFFADKRQALIQRIVELLVLDTDIAKSQTIQSIENKITLQSSEYCLSPYFIVEFTIYFTKYAHDFKSPNDNIFSTIFEASIETSISEHLTQESYIEITMVISELAYHIHRNKAYPLHITDIENIILKYNDDYGQQLKIDRFIKIVTSANLMTGVTSFEFKKKDHLAYFVSKAILQRSSENDPDVEEALKEIIELSCFSINPTILKFLAYSTNNTNLIRILLNQAQIYVNEWPDYDLLEQKIFFLDDVLENSKLLKSSSQKTEIQQKAKSEKAQAELDSEIEIVSIYDYNLDELNTLNNQLLRAHLQMITLANCLATFGPKIKTDLKNEIISSLYSMPNKIFYKWAHDFELQFRDTIEAISKERFLGKSDSDEMTNMLKEIYNATIMLLTNMYYTVSRNAVSLSNIGILTNEDFIETMNHQLQMLMFYEQTDQHQLFITKSEIIYEETDNSIVRTIIKLMVKHLLIWSPTLSVDKRHRLLEKFHLEDMKKAILLAQNKKK